MIATRLYLFVHVDRRRGVNVHIEKSAEAFVGPNAHAVLGQAVASAENAFCFRLSLQYANGHGTITGRLEKILHGCLRTGMIFTGASNLDCVHFYCVVQA